MARSWFTGLALGLVLAWCGSARPALAQPAAQTAFRAVLVKYDERADAETDLGRLRALEAERAAELAAILGEALRFDEWQLILSGTEPTPMGGIFVRFLDATLVAPRSARPTYWNSGPGLIMRQAEIPATAPLRGPVALLKRGATVVVSGNFFPGDHGGPFFESAKISSHAVAVERAKFRMPYFSIRLVDVAELFPEPRFP